MSGLRLGTRGSALALAQTEGVAQRLRGRGVMASAVPVAGAGDGYSALRAALVAGEIDVAVHSCKDVPIEADPRVVIAAVPARADPRDALVARDGMVLGELPAAAVDILRLYPNPEAQELREALAVHHGASPNRSSLAIARTECSRVRSLPS